MALQFSQITEMNTNGKETIFNEIIKKISENLYL